MDRWLRYVVPLKLRRSLTRIVNCRSVQTYRWGGWTESTEECGRQEWDRCNNVNGNIIQEGQADRHQVVGGADEEGSRSFVAKWTVGESVSGVYISTISLIEPRISGDEDKD